MAKKLTNDEAYARVCHIAAIMKVTLNGDQALEAAKYLLDDSRAEELLVRAAKVAGTKKVTLNGSEWVRVAQFIKP